MKYPIFSWFLSAGLLLAGLAASLSTARADAWDKHTTITFNEPVEIPGMVLPAGTYVMKLADDPYNRDVVQFFNQNETHLYDTVLAIPAYRATATDHTVIRFEERKAGAPQAVKIWYYPGDLRGEELLYKKPHPVLTQQTALNAPPPVQQTPKPVPQPQAAAPAPTPAQPPVETAQAQTAPPAPSPAPAPAPTSLPKTASDLPLVGLLGFGLLAAGTLVRFLDQELTGSSR